MAATKTKPSTDQTTVEEATAEANEASALVEALEERIRTGDSTVTLEELEKAQRLATFAAMLVDGAKHRAHQARVEAATKSLTASAKTLADAVASDKQFIDARTALTKALAAYLGEADSHEARVADAIRTFTEARFTATNLEIGVSFEELGVELEASHVAVARTEDGARLLYPLAEFHDTTEQLRVALEPAGLTLRGQIERHGGNQ